jgi:hypothetical protein
VCGELLILAERENEVHLPTVERRLEVRSVMMRLLFPLLGYLPVTLARLAGGSRGNRSPA